ncbi:hypothetical protein [Candidatus Uabimicrobium amorphum]|uniref:Uncharacterized protein n=1 Tax=Uabimicrobium amorphum TaxID=2596890 RepID=A0A5S9F3M9_UABAM|nr:hypothetical protein [Candidatus Uabimicrobium amorphum]BBM84905.1 hypothetical protein UABAM_03266 [Candidatus Uabimicrobium amorphum]
MPLYFLLMLYIVLVPFGLCQSPQYLYIKEFKIHKLKQNGKHWDSFKGSPDVKCNIYTLQNGIWKKAFTSNSYNNTLHVDSEMGSQIEVYPDFQIKIEVVDLDLGDHDTIGKLNVTIHKDDFSESTCEISFDRVEKFVYFFSPYRTVSEKKFAEKVSEEANKKLEEYKKSVAKEIKMYKKKIAEMEKKLREKETRISEYTKIIEHLTEKIRTLKRETEDEAWDQFEDDLKDDH